MRTCCQRAFSLTELLVVVAILGVLAALMFPVLVRAKEESKVAACMEGMKNYHRAVMLYRLDYEAADAGNVYEMGLPTGPQAGKLTADNCMQCAGKLPIPMMRHVATPPREERSEAYEWEPYVRSYGDASIILYTWNFNTEAEYWDLTHPVRGIGVTLGGWIVNKRKANDLYKNHLWFH